MSDLERQDDEQRSAAAKPEAQIEPEVAPAAVHRPSDNGTGAPDDYGADKIKVLEGPEPARNRPAMYIGSTGAPGLHHLVYEIVDNSIDEALAGHCDLVNVTLHIDNSITVVDNGRGIPVDQHVSGKSAAEVGHACLHAGERFGDELHGCWPALRGRDLSVVN